MEELLAQSRLATGSASTAFRSLVSADMQFPKITDGNGNEKIEIAYEGSYERLIVSNDTLIFSEDFANGVANMLLYEGDKLNPTEEMLAWDFTADGRPWVPVRDDEASRPTG